jgi:hypothetical protein
MILVILVAALALAAYALVFEPMAAALHFGTTVAWVLAVFAALFLFMLFVGLVKLIEAIGQLPMPDPLIPRVYRWAKSKSMSGAHASSFAHSVAQNVIMKKRFIAVAWTLTALVWVFFGTSHWFIWLSFVPGLWFYSDVLAVRFRLDTGEYGGTRAEVLDAVRYIVRQRKGGGGGGDFSRIFETAVPKRVRGWAPEAEAGARS